MKIVVKQVLSEAYSFYRSNFKYLAGVSFVYTVLTAGINLITLLDTSSLRPEILLVLLYLMLAFAIVALVVLPRLFPAVIILINSLFDENRMTLSEAYWLTKGKYWFFLSRILLLGLIVLVPFIIITLIKLPFSSELLTVCTGFIMALFCMLTPIMALEPKTTGYLKKSTHIIKGNYVAILILFFITTTLLALINVAAIHMFSDKAIALHIIKIAYFIIYFFVFPFSQTVIVIIYRKLAKGTQAPQEAISR